MIELLIMLGAILVGGSGLVLWLRLTDEWAERDRMARFQAAMRKADPSRTQRED